MGVHASACFHLPNLIRLRRMNTEPIFVTGYKSSWPGSRWPQHKAIVARLARVAVAGVPYHVTRRSNRREDILFPPAAIRKHDITTRSKIKGERKLVFYPRFSTLPAACGSEAQVGSATRSRKAIAGQTATLLLSTGSSKPADPGPQQPVKWDAPRHSGAAPTFQFFCLMLGMRDASVRLTLALGRCETIGKRPG